MKIDGSSTSLSTAILISGASEWPRSAQVVAELIAALTQEALLGVYLLGTRRCWAAGDWRADTPLPPEAAHALDLVAPVMGALQARREYPRAVVLVGAGPTIDLLDWVQVRRETRWAWVRGNEPTSDSVDEMVLMASPDDMGPLVAFLSSHAAVSPIPRPIPPDGFVAHSWTLDRAGFPLVYVPPVQGFVQLFPVSKPQFELFLAGARLPAYGPAEYAALLNLNPRLSPCAARLAEPEQLFITGLVPADVEAYVRWQAGGLRPLTIDEWRTAFGWLRAQPLSVWPAELERDLSPVAECLWRGLLAQLQPKTLLDLSLMQGGVVEWVTGPGGAWLGMGQPRGQFYPTFHNALDDHPFAPTSLERRSKLFGLRLMQPA